MQTRIRPRKSGNQLVAGVGLAGTAHLSRWPARLDLVQSATGLVLVLFMWSHMFVVSRILVSNDEMWTITRFFEGCFFFGRSYFSVVSFMVAGVIALTIVHAFLAMRKFPIDYRQFMTLQRVAPCFVYTHIVCLWRWVSR